MVDNVDVIVMVMNGYRKITGILVTTIYKQSS